MVFECARCVGTQAVANAKRLAAVLRETAPGVRVAEPDGADWRQPSLFDP